MRVRSSLLSRSSKGLASTLRCAVVAAALPLAILASAPAAFAEDVSAQDIAQARQLGQQAQVAFDAGTFAESEKLWAAAAKLYAAAPTLTLGLARTQVKLGKFVAAQENYNKIIRVVGSATSPQPPAFAAALESAKAEVGPVSAKIASVTLTVEGPSAPQVTIDGQLVNAAALGLRRPIDPGQHVVKASADGYKPSETTFSVTEGGNTAAVLKMEKSAIVKADKSESAIAVVAPRGTTDPGSDSKGSSNKTLALVAFGVGGAGLVVGAVAGVIAAGKASDLDKACPDKTCPNSKQDDVDSYTSVGTISTIGFIVAGVGGATGLVLLLTAPKSSHGATGSHDAPLPVTPERRGLSMSAYFGGTAAGIRGSF